MPETKYIEQKVQSFDGALFTMTLFSAKKLENTVLLSEEKFKMASKVP